MNLQEAIEKFDRIIKEQRLLGKSLSYLYWDMETQTPKEGNEMLSEVVGYINSKKYELMVSIELQEAMKIMRVNIEDLEELKKRELEEASEQIENIMCVPKDEYVDYKKLLLKSGSIWREARAKSDFSIFKEELKKIIEYNRKLVEYRGHKGHPYDLFLDMHESGMTVERLDLFFHELKKEIVPFLREIKDRDVNIDFLTGPVDVENEKRVAKKLLEYIGFDFNRGVMGESTHPFCTHITRDDVRLTTRYEENWLPSSIFGALHEGGHGIYNQGIGEHLNGNILGTGISSGVHESQSRFYENMIGRSMEFWKPIYKEISGELKALNGVSLEDYYRGINRTKASFIRVEADELTYSLHIMLRYEIEKMLIEESLDVEDLPRVWNEKVEEYLGIVPPTDALGVLQDTHWAMGLFGYFPTYAIGNVYASQLYKEMEKELDIKKLLEEGELVRIKEWLGEKVHIHGATKKPNELIEDICGEGLNGKVFTDYLKEKYTKIYL